MGASRSQPPLRIGFDGRILMHYEMRGLARYTVELFRAMKELVGAKIELFSFSPGTPAAKFLAELDVTPIIFQARRELLWEHVELPKQLRRLRIDVYHATAERGLPYQRVCKLVLTRHDIIDRLPEFCGGENLRGRLRKRLADFVSVRSADKFVTVSEFSRQDICRLYGLPEDRVIVTYNAAHPRFLEKATLEEIAHTRTRYALPQNYLLFLGGFDTKKNVGALVEAYALLPQDAPDLVLAGEHKWQYPDIAARIQTLGLTQRVHCPGGVNDADLPALYQAALAFIHPSRYEGFGLQLVEAMASGIPVLASNTTSLPEVLAGSGLLFDPQDPEAIARQMERIYRDADLRTAMAAKGRERARQFSWRRTASRTLQLYLELLDRGDESPYRELDAAGEELPS
jgi:glycosyltransferase involved in cell wall biosynthesis